MSSPEAVVIGAGGLVGRLVADALADAGLAVAVVARRALPGVRHRAFVADARDPAALARALAGARVVVNAAAPLRDTATPVLAAALAAGAHYVDVGGEQAVVRAVYEQHESAVRRAGLVALPGAGLDCLIGDLAAARAAAIVAGGAPEPAGDDELLRAAPAPRLAEDAPLDEVTVTYAFDELALSAGTQRAWFAAVGERAQVWRRDRWEAARAGDGRRVNAGAALGGERTAIAHAGGDAITVPRHVAARFVGTYLSPTRNAGAASALRLLARALPLVPRAAQAVLAPYADPEADYARTRFAVVAQARRGFDASRVVITGAGAYRTTALAAAWAARMLAARGAGPVGVLAPAELFHAGPALRALAAVAALAVET